MSNKMKIVVIGGSGLIGAKVVNIPSPARSRRHGRPNAVSRKWLAMAILLSLSFDLREEKSKSNSLRNELEK